MRLCIIASLVLVLLLAACGDDGNNTDSDRKVQIQVIHQPAITLARLRFR